MVAEGVSTLRSAFKPPFLHTLDYLTSNEVDSNLFLRKLSKGFKRGDIPFTLVMHMIVCADIGLSTRNGSVKKYTLHTTVSIPTLRKVIFGHHRRRKCLQREISEIIKHHTIYRGSQ